MDEIIRIMEELKKEMTKLPYKTYKDFQSPTKAMFDSVYREIESLIELQHNGGL